MASPIRLRAAADRCRLRPLVLLRGPDVRWPRCNAAMALLSRSRSPSNSAMIDCMSKGVVLLVSRMGMILQEANMSSPSENVLNRLEEV